MKTITYNPETNVLVPREPSQDMITAGIVAHAAHDFLRVDHTYRAMLAAAPQPEPVDVGSVGWKHDCAALCANDIELWIDRCPHCGKPRHNHPPTDDELLNKAEQVESEPVAWCLAYDDPNLKLRIHSNPTMCEAEIDAHVNRLNGALSKAPLYTTPQPDRTAELEAALKVARDALIDCEGALDECRDYPITYDAIIEALTKINDALSNVRISFR